MLSDLGPISIWHPQQVDGGRPEIESEGILELRSEVCAGRSDLDELLLPPASTLAARKPMFRVQSRPVAPRFI